MRASVASASAENSSPAMRPSAPLAPTVKATVKALIRIAPQAAPAALCAIIMPLRFGAKSAARMASAPNRPAPPMTARPPRRLAIRLAGSMATLKPIQNTGISHSRSAGLA